MKLVTHECFILEAYLIRIIMDAPLQLSETTYSNLASTTRRLTKCWAIDFFYKKVRENVKCSLKIEC
jgi:hypothetical protein